MSEFPDCLLVANRGEIARRIIRTAKRLGVHTIAIYDPVDVKLPFVAEADEAVALSGETPVKSYLDGDAILKIAVEHGASAVHPGYGFLAESADFARSVTEAGLKWVGPSAEAIVKMGDKVESRRAVAEAGVPISGDAGAAQNCAAEAVAEAHRIGYPVMVKASAGGGGIGMAVAHDDEELRTAFENTRSMAARSFGNDRVFVECFIAAARHVEVQILGCEDGTIVELGERDCSTQRRHQKVIEESPAPNLNPETRDRLIESAIAAAKSVNYVNAGTVEFLVDTTTGDFVFLEMNTRIQVEHPITELTHGVDIVEQQLAIAQTGTTTKDFSYQQNGHAIELRICAEDPKRFYPRPGPILSYTEPTGEGIRVDSGFTAGTEVSQHFDSLVAKVCAFGPDRPTALARARQALADLEIEGLTTNAPFIEILLETEEFVSGHYDTGLVEATQAEQKRLAKLAAKQEAKRSA
ncbi:acetyl-CoA carboxylase, biotin carboxylase subunit [Brevibacterium siliguriense]|uniref:biotin carboxylase n=1 Tax=Brevibacterium siliguriense TaxID=1136497 RepID=A0A1H1Y5K7_9MICO|nr:biotin carboxylase N-terminal domain-containing protein [Brevibacterium siliguriense]SDT16778.1 acetyl-CoA carboxylase, biotin carboxylase subunit [Brevibacterium siliguriense]